MALRRVASKRPPPHDVQKEAQQGKQEGNANDEASPFLSEPDAKQQRVESSASSPEVQQTGKPDTGGDQQQVAEQAPVPASLTDHAEAQVDDGAPLVSAADVNPKLDLFGFEDMEPLFPPDQQGEPTNDISALARIPFDTGTHSLPGHTPAMPGLPEYEPGASHAVDSAAVEVGASTDFFNVDITDDYNDDFDSKLEDWTRQCQSHVLFAEYLLKIENELAEDFKDWTFGDPDGDAWEDLKDFHGFVKANYGKDLLTHFVDGETYDPRYAFKVNNGLMAAREHNMFDSYFTSPSKGGDSASTKLNFGSSNPWGDLNRFIKFVKGNSSELLLGDSNGAASVVGGTSHAPDNVSQSFVAPEQKAKSDTKDLPGNAQDLPAAVPDMDMASEDAGLVGASSSSCKGDDGAIDFSWLDPGNFLESCGMEMLRRVYAKYPSYFTKLPSGPAECFFDSSCTGTGNFELAGASACCCITQFLKEKGSSESEGSEAPESPEVFLEGKTQFAFELEQWKRRHLISGVLSKGACCFTDVTTAGNDSKRKCVVHNDKPCDIPRTFALGSGFSCTSFSPLQNDYKLFKKALSNLMEESTSFRTFAGNLDLIKRADPLWILLENVDITADMETDPESNAALIMKALEDRDFTVRFEIIYASQYGLPQRRKRLYIVGINNERAANELTGTPEAYLDEIFSVLMPSMELPVVPVDTILLPRGDPDVDAELARRLQRAKDKDTEHEGRGDKWKTSHMALAEARGLPWPIRVSQFARSSPWFGVLPWREQENLGFAEALSSDRISKGMARLRFADLYHSAHRIPTSGVEVVPTVLPSGKVWDMDNNRMVIGQEALRLQGCFYPPGVLSKLSDAQMQDLGGNAFPATVVMAIILAVILTLEYKTDSDNEGDSVIDMLVAKISAGGVQRGRNAENSD